MTASDDPPPTIAELRSRFKALGPPNLYARWIWHRYWHIRSLNHKRSHAFYRREGARFCPGCAARLNP